MRSSTQARWPSTGASFSSTRLPRPASPAILSANAAIGGPMLFLLGNQAVREVFLAHHADLLDASFWQAHKERIAQGHVYDVFPYEREKRFDPDAVTTDLS